MSTPTTHENWDGRKEYYTSLEVERLRSQCDANFLAGVEIGVRCHEKGMNLQAAILYARRVIKEFPQTAPATPTQEPPLEKCAQCGKLTEETWSCSDGVNKSIRVCADCRGER